FLNVEIESNLAAAEWNPPSSGCGLHAWQRAHAIKQLFVKCGRVLRLRITRFRKGDTRGHDIARIKTGRHFLQAKKTFDEQAGAREQTRRENNSDNNESGGSPAGGRFSRAARTFVKRSGEFWMRNPPRRKQTGKDSNEQTDQRGEDEDPWIGGEFVNPRNVGQKRFQRFDSPNSDQQSGKTAKHTEQNAFEA